MKAIQTIVLVPIMLAVMLAISAVQIVVGVLLWLWLAVKFVLVDVPMSVFWGQQVKKARSPRAIPPAATGT